MAPSKSIVPRVRPSRPLQVWKTVPGEKRRALLHTIADKIEARAEEIALVESVDSGQAIRYMSKAALRGAENFRFYADKAPAAADGLSMPTDTHLNYTVRQPIGPGRRDHAVEHAVHAVDLEDRAGAGGRLHRRAQAGGMEPADRGDPVGDHERGLRGRRPAERASSISFTGSAKAPAKR